MGQAYTRSLHDRQQLYEQGFQWRTRAGSGAPNGSQGIGEEGGNVLLIARGGEAPHVHPARVARRLLRRRLRSCKCTEQPLGGGKPMTSSPQVLTALSPKLSGPK